MDCTFRRCCHMAAALLLIAAAAGGQARSSGGNTSSYPSPSSTSTSSRSTVDPNTLPSRGMDFPDGLDPNFSHRQIVARRDDLKKRMTDNATRLLALTRALQSDLQGREATEEDAKRLDEIAKLAHTVRDQMRQ